MRRLQIGLQKVMQSGKINEIAGKKVIDKVASSKRDNYE